MAKTFEFVRKSFYGSSLKSNGGPPNRQEKLKPAYPEGHHTQ